MSGENPAIPPENISFTKVDLNEETQETQERLGDGWATIIELQRHGPYYNGQPADFDNPTEEEKQMLGHLTEEGKEITRQTARERVERILGADASTVDFLVLASPTHWLGRPEFGQRAVETGQIIAEEIAAILEEKGLSQDQLLQLKGKTERGTLRQEDKIRESDLFEVPEFANFMRREYKGQGRPFWDAVNADTHRDIRERLGAEGPQDVASRVNLSINALARFGRHYEQANPGRKLAVFAVSHSEDLEPYAQRVLGVTPSEFTPTYNQSIEVTVDKDGNAVALVGDKHYPVSLAKHGLPEPIIDNRA